MAAISHSNDITAIHREDHDDLSLIYRFDTRRFKRYLADLSAINHGNKARHSAIIACMEISQVQGNVSLIELTFSSRGIVLVL